MLNFRQISCVRLLATLTVALLLEVYATETANAQFYFGKNKIQYTHFDWQVMITDHFRVYYYSDEEEIARIGARLAETSYRVLSGKFNHEIPKKVPLIFYSSPGYFTQTNVLPGMLPESVAGFTEFIKGRVVVPFNGSHHDFAHVIRHELVHAFMLSRLDEALSRRSRVRPFFPPLWFTEGLAEFWSRDWDAGADMIVKDLVVNGKLFSIRNLYQVQGTYYMYKLGESILHFIDTTYGSDKIARLFDNWHKGRTFDQVVKITLGDDLETLSGKWEYHLKKKYFPEMKDLGLPTMESKQITYGGFSEKGVPVRYDDGDGAGDWIVYKANRMGYSGIYMTKVTGKKRKVRTLLKGERSSDYESLHLLRSGIDANDSGLVVFSSKSKERDVLYLYDLNRGRVTERYEFEDLVEIRSPRFSPDAGRVVFSGVKKDGFTDLYVLDLAGGEYQALTADIYHDTDPAFSCDGKKIVFASDRCADGPEGAMNLFEFDLSTRHVRQLTYGPFRDQTPDCTPNGVYFSSDRGGTFNIFHIDNNGRMARQSTYVTGAFSPRLTQDGARLVYTGYEDMGYQVYQMEINEAAEPVPQPLASKTLPWQPPQIGRESSHSSVKYDKEYSFDIAQSAVGYDPVYGSLGGFQAAVSDMLGNHAYYLLLTNTAQTKSELLESFNLGVTYVNRERRLNWGVGLFHLYDEYRNLCDISFFERQAGAISMLSYPISKFHRLDFATIGKYSKREQCLRGNDREAFLVANYLSWVYDNSLWDISGPIEGRRYNFTIGHSTSLDPLESFTSLAMADVRHYFRLGRYSALANRLLVYTSSGKEPQRIYLGGSWSFRGYDRRKFYNRNVLFASTELRFPLIDILLIGFPFGGLDFRGIRGAAFFDAGSASDDDLDKVYGSFGFGIRVAIGYVVQLRFDFTRTTDFKTISADTDFDFFFGWNF